MNTDIKFEAMLVRDIEPKAFFPKDGDNWQETSHHWKVTINGQQFDYFTGCGHRTPYGSIKPKNPRRFHEAEEWICQSRATKPSLDDVLNCLLSDALAMDQSFEDWCSDLELDTDSRKALDQYLACQDSGHKLRRAKIDLEFHRERLQDY